MIAILALEDVTTIWDNIKYWIKNLKLTDGYKQWETALKIMIWKLLVY